MKKTMTFAVSVVFLSASLALPSFAEVKAGTPCKQAGKVIQTAGMKYKCVKSGKKLVWGKGQLTQNFKRVKMSLAYFRMR